MSITLTELSVGFTIAGGTTSKTLTVSADANVSGTNTGDLTLSGENYLSLSGQAITDTTNASNITSGTLPAVRLPNPSASTLGGVESYAAVTHQWINNISTSGVPGSTQPAFSDLSGTPTVAQMPFQDSVAYTFF